MAVHRNKIKRWIREIFKKNLLSKGYVVVVRSGFLEAGFKNISFILGDGHLGFLNSAPYDAIIITAAAEDLPENLIEQLSPSGRIVLPLAHGNEQKLIKLKNTKNGIIKKVIENVVFVPMLKGIESI